MKTDNWTEFMTYLSGKIYNSNSQTGISWKELFQHFLSNTDTQKTREQSIVEFVKICFVETMIKEPEDFFRFQKINTLLLNRVYDEKVKYLKLFKEYNQQKEISVFEKAGYQEMAAFIALAQSSNFAAINGSKVYKTGLMFAEYKGLDTFVKEDLFDAIQAIDFFLVLKNEYKTNCKFTYSGISFQFDKEYKKIAKDVEAYKRLKDYPEFVELKYEINQRINACIIDMLWKIHHKEAPFC